MRCANRHCDRSAVAGYCCAPCGIAADRYHAPAMHTGRCEAAQGAPGGPIGPGPGAAPAQVLEEPQDAIPASWAPFQRSGDTSRVAQPRSAPYEKQSDTSREAAEKVVASGRAATNRMKALALVRERGGEGATGYEVADHFDGHPSEWFPRLYELVDDRLILMVARTRKNPTGRPAHPYVAVEHLLPDDSAAPARDRRCPHCGGEI